MHRVTQFARKIRQWLSDFWCAPTLKQQFLDSIQEPDHGLFNRFNSKDSKK